MVKNMMGLTGHGLRDWLIQRVSAVVMLVYIVVVGGYLLMHSPMTFAVWHGLFQQAWMRVATLLMMMSLVVHAWIGIWTVTTDYLNSCVYLRMTVQIAVILTLLIDLSWSIQILWG